MPLNFQTTSELNGTDYEAVETHACVSLAKLVNLTKVSDIICKLTLTQYYQEKPFYVLNFTFEAQAAHDITFTYFTATNTMTSIMVYLGGVVDPIRDKLIPNTLPSWGDKPSRYGIPYAAPYSDQPSPIIIAFIVLGVLAALAVVVLVALIIRFILHRRHHKHHHYHLEANLPLTGQ